MFLDGRIDSPTVRLNGSGPRRLSNNHSCQVVQQLSAYELSLPGHSLPMRGLGISAVVLGEVLLSPRLEICDDYRGRWCSEVGSQVR